MDDIIGRAKSLGANFLGEMGKDLQRFSDLKDFHAELLEEANELAQIKGADAVLFDQVIPEVEKQLRILSGKLRCNE